MKQLFRVFAIFSICLHHAWADPIIGEKIYTRAIEIRALPIDVAGQAHPVRLEGILTFMDPATGIAFFQDETSGISLDLPKYSQLPKELKMGSRVIVQGVTSRGLFLPSVAGIDGGIPKIEVLDEASMPPSKAVRGPDLIVPKMDSQWIELWGMVRPPPSTYRNAALTVETEGRTFFVYLPGNATQREISPNLLGAPVRIRAVAGTFVNSDRQMTRRVLFLPSMEFITADSRPEIDDPFSSPLTVFDDLLRAQTAGAGERVKVRGTVLLALPNEGLYLRESSGGALRVQTSQEFSAPMVRPGDVVEAVGWPEASDFRPELRGGLFRVIDRQQPLRANPESLSEILSGRHHADYVELEASVIGISVEPSGIKLLMNNHNIFFEARIPAMIATVPDPLWVRDSRLKIRGIAENVPSDALTNPQVSQTFFVRVSQLSDIVLLESPPWWTAKHMLWLLVGTLGCGLLVASWAFALRRRVAYQTKIIENQVHREGVQEERQRLARELHDSLEQEMTGVGLQLETAMARLEHQPEAARTSVERARRLLHRAQRETRETIWDLRSSPTDPHVLPSYLEEILQPLAESAGAVLHVTCDVAEAAKVSSGLMHHITRVASEAVANATKHGHAKNVRLNLTIDDSELCLRVQDDGSGFIQAEAPGARQGHFGLTGMQERAGKCGGSVQISSSIGAGTEICFRAPLENESHPNHETIS